MEACDMHLTVSFGWSRLWVFVIICTAAWKTIESAKILAFFPHPLMSHQHVYRPVIEALGKRGHQVTYFSGFAWKGDHPNVEHRMLDLSFIGELRNKVFDFSLEAIDSYNSLFGLFSAPLNEAAMLISQNVLRDPKVQDLIRSNETYDLVMTEALMGYEHCAALAHKFNATSITFLARGDSAWANEMSGLTDTPSYMVDFKSPYGIKMSRLERFHNSVILHATRFHGYRYLIRSQALADKFFVYPGSETRPPIDVLARDQAVILVNSHHSVGYAYPKAPHVKEVGGVSIQQPRKLPRKIRDFVEDSSDGVIYFSLGNYLDFSSPFKEATRNLFLEVFSKRKERILWKWSGEGLESKPENIMFLRWMPQTDILAHPNTKLFISHGGLLSMMEAVNFAVPLVGIVMGEDSRKNMRVARESGYALDIDFSKLTVESLNSIIDEIIDNPKFKENAKKVEFLFKDRPLKPVEESVYWIEYVARHGKVLQPESVHMPYYVLYMWDIFTVSLLLVIVIISVLIIFVGLIVTCIVRLMEHRSPTATLLAKDRDKDKCS